MKLTTRATRAAKAAAISEDKRRSVEAARLAERRRLGRDITIPEIRDPARRERGREDPEYFLRTYWREKFHNPFCRHHKAMIQCLVDRILYGGRQAIAAPRGDGKSSIIEGMAGIWAIVYGLRRFVVLIGENQPDASARLSSVMREYEFNPKLLDDFPEICYPIRRLHRSPRIGNQQTVDGEYTQIIWATGRRVTEIRFPIVPGSLASGSWVVAVGIEGKIRGLLRGSERPDLAILDDIESEDSVESPTETRRIRRTISRAVLPLGGPNTRIAVFMPCTIIKRGCLADEYTNRQQAPAWMGLRFPLIMQWPDDMDSWATYRTMRQDAQKAGDETARAAHAFYLGNRETMDAGCIASNPYRFVADECPDGSQLQISTIQFAMDWIADETSKLGDDEAWASFNAEYQNDPPESEMPTGSGCTVDAVRSALNGIPGGFCPTGTQYITAGIDVGGYELHWSVIAWVGAAAHVIDYGTTPVNSPRAGRLLDPDNLADTQTAIANALYEWRDWEAENGWPIAGGNGEVMHVSRVLVDSRWQPDPVYSMVSQSPRPTFWAASGEGSAKGQKRYRQPTTRGRKGDRVGFHYWIGKVSGRAGAWLVHADSDFWKTFIHAGFTLTTTQGKAWKPSMPASMALYGTKPTVHNNFAAHIMCEEFREQFVPGKGLKKWWEQRHKNNHWLDATGYACAAGAMIGIPFVHAPRTPKAAGQRGRRIPIAGRVQRFGR